MTPPSVLDVELTEQEVKKSLVDILNSMESLRQQQIKDNNISNEEKNEYLHLTYRLASILESFTANESDQLLVDKMQSVIESVNNNPALMHYDFSQDAFWRNVEPEFVKTLDQVLIQIKGDDFSGLQDKHHFINALKYLAGEGLSQKERTEVYDSITPFNEMNKSPNKERLLKNLDKLGKKITINGTTIKVEDCKKVKELREAASLVGFEKIQVVIDTNEKNIMDNGKIVGEYAQPPKPKKWNKFWRRLTKLTAPISYPIIGSLPKKYQKKLEDYFTSPEDVRVLNNYKDYRLGDRVNHPHYGLGEFNALFNPNHVHFSFFNGEGKCSNHMDLSEKTNYAVTTGHFKTYPAFFTSLILEAGISAFLLNRGHISNDYALITSDGSVFDFALIGGMFLAAATLFRTIGSFAEFGTTGSPVVRLGLEIASLPLKLPINIFKKDKSTKSWIEYKTEQISQETSKEIKLKQHNLQDPLELLAQKELSDDLEQNLVWSLNNHHTQGEYFSKELFAGTNFAKPRKYRSPYVNRETNSWGFIDVLRSNPYKKSSVMMCFKGKRYVMTCINQNDKTIHLDEPNKILAKDISFDQKLSELAALTDAEYFHLSEFVNNKKTNDKTYTK